ncbi:hypothetical protein AKJ16_DCAP13026 [Drosera capensis]
MESVDGDDGRHRRGDRRCRHRKPALRRKHFPFTKSDIGFLPFWILVETRVFYAEWDPFLKPQPRKQDAPTTK